MSMLFFCKEGMFYSRFLMVMQDSFSGLVSKLPEIQWKAPFLLKILLSLLASRGQPVTRMRIFLTSAGQRVTRKPIFSASAGKLVTRKPIFSTRTGKLVTRSSGSATARILSRGDVFFKSHDAIVR